MDLPHVMNEEAAGLALSGLAAACGATLTGDHAEDVTVTSALIVEPGEPYEAVPGTLVLAVGARGPAAATAVTTAAAAGAAAVAIRLGAGAPDVPDALRAVAEAVGVPVIALPADVRWERVEAELRRAREKGTAERRTRAPHHRADLFSLAQTVATLTFGVVSIEDSAHRVLAYAGPGEEADEPRRQSILGRHCPEPYLALLREAGVYRRIRAGGEVVAVEARPDRDMRRRRVIGVGAGGRPLGTIWVQEGSRPLAPGTDDALRGAARLAAPQLIDHYYEGDAAARLASRADLAHSLLTGRFNSGALAAHLGIDPSSAAFVVAFDLREAPGPGDTSEDTARQEARRSEAAEIIAVHAASARRDTLVAQACGQIYAMLPAPAAAGPQAPADDDAVLVRWATEVVTALRLHLRTPVQAVVAGRARSLEDIPRVKLRGHHALEIMTRTPQAPVGTHDALTASLMVRDVLRLLEGHEEIRHAALESLTAHDAEQGTRLADSLLRYLDAFGDVTGAARTLNIHPNTLRYRVRRAAALTGLDLDDPEHRLAAMLQLRLGRDGGAAPSDPFPVG
ncbi:helix-turn-helix domain-containing protein [Streptomyces sp. NPDC051920]|uniref:PucR family transcriptional regulator n=1 Tax=Streptomyces sp. NPDC051920 TaxID=3155523 RepID=UPI00341633AE